MTVTRDDMISLLARFREERDTAIANNKILCRALVAASALIAQMVEGKTDPVAQEQWREFHTEMSKRLEIIIAEMETP